MSETVESYLARGGAIKTLPVAPGARETKQKRGDGLRRRLDAEVRSQANVRLPGGNNGR